MKFWLALLLLTPLVFAGVDVSVTNSAFIVGKPSTFFYSIKCGNTDNYFLNGDLVYYKLDINYGGQVETIKQSKFIFEPNCNVGGSFTANIPVRIVQGQNATAVQNVTVTASVKRFDEPAGYYPFIYPFVFTYQFPDQQDYSFDSIQAQAQAQQQSFNLFSWMALGALLAVMGGILLILRNPLGFIGLVVGFLLVILNFLHVI